MFTAELSIKQEGCNRGTGFPQLKKNAMLNTQMQSLFFFFHLRSVFLPAPVNDVEQGEMFVCGSQIRFTCLDEKLFQVILG